MAARLIGEFGSMAAALAGSRRRQYLATGGDRGVVEALVLFREAMEHALATVVQNEPVITDGAALARYLRPVLAWRTTEAVRLLHLDARNRLIRDELLSEGTIDRVPVYIREVMHRALDLGSASFIMVHNHPTGDPSPSSGDISLTRELDAAARCLGIVLLDHVIVGRSTQVSFRSLGLLAA